MLPKRVRDRWFNADRNLSSVDQKFVPKDNHANFVLPKLTNLKISFSNAMR